MTADPGQTVRSFDVTAPLARRTLIEASAGTGKTYTLCALTAYLLGSGQATVDEFLIVTFTKLATADLKGRIRSRIATVRSGLDSPPPPDGDADEVVTALRADGDAIARLDEALRDLSDLAVSTIHGFAQHALTRLGSSAGLDPDRAVLADDSSITEDVIADELAVLALNCPAELSTSDGESWIPEVDAVARIVKLLGAVPDLGILPETSGVDLYDLIEEQQQVYQERREAIRAEIETVATKKARTALERELKEAFTESERVRAGWIAQRVSAKARLRRRQGSIRNYGDLLTDLRGAVSGAHGSEVRRRLRATNRFVLVDEFQDTDRVQWDIFDRCFGTTEEGDPSKLVIVGDPKQAIYRFRGADVHVYSHVAALDEVDRFQQGVNHRSDAGLLRGLDVLFTGTRFGPGAGFIRVGASQHHRDSRIRWRDGGSFSPVRVAVDFEPAKKGDLETRGVTDCVAWIRRLKDHALLFRTDVESAEGWQALRYDDIAVLVRTGKQGLALQRALNLAGIPAVAHTEVDVRVDPSRHSYAFGDAPSEAAWQWQLLLEAIGNPSDPKRARAAAAGIFGPDLGPGDPVSALGDNERITSFQQNLSAWSKTLARSGPADLLARLRSETDWVRRAASRNDNDRLFTDLGHLGELLIMFAGSRATSTDRLLEALTDTATNAEGEQITSRRLPTDATAVTIMTAHKAKGLEFPIVGCIGFDDVWDVKQARFHEPGTTPGDPGRDLLDLERHRESVRRAGIEERDESLRLLYVALTRAKHHVFTSWGARKGKDALGGSISRVLFARTDAGDGNGYRIDPAKFSPETDAIDAAGYEEAPPAPPAIEVAPTVLADLEERSADPESGTPTLVFGAFIAPAPDAVPSSNDRGGDHVDPGTPAVDDELAVARLGHALDRRFRRWSYTAISRAARVGSDDDAPHQTRGGTDEGPNETSETPRPAANDRLMDNLVRGPRFGTMVHGALERIDFTAADLPTEIRTEIDRQLTISPMSLLDGPGPGDGRELLVDGLVGAIHTPLGVAGSTRSLRDIAFVDRLDECQFDLRLDTDRAPGGTLHQIGTILTDPGTGLDTDDPYRPWAEHLRDNPVDVDLSGHLTGSIDLVFRVAAPDGSPRFFVADYKTNALGDYSPAALIGAMVEHDYPLQALLYSVALHRFLRWRVSGYEPDAHLGGARYLFLRGMTGATEDSAGDPPGVARWRIPTDVLDRVDALFAAAVTS